MLIHGKEAGWVLRKKGVILVDRIGSERSGPRDTGIEGKSAGIGCRKRSRRGAVGPLEHSGAGVPLPEAFGPVFGFGLKDPPQGEFVFARARGPEAGVRAGGAGLPAGDAQGNRAMST